MSGLLKRIPFLWSLRLISVIEAGTQTEALARPRFNPLRLSLTMLQASRFLADSCLCCSARVLTTQHSFTSGFSEKWAMKAALSRRLLWPFHPVQYFSPQARDEEGEEVSDLSLPDHLVAAGQDLRASTARKSHSNSFFFFFGNGWKKIIDPLVKHSLRGSPILVRKETLLHSLASFQCFQRSGRNCPKGAGLLGL